MSQDIPDPSLPKFVYLDIVFLWKCYDTPRLKYTEARGYVLLIHLKSAMKVPNLELNCNNAIFCFFTSLGPIFSPKKSPKKNSAAFAYF